MQLTKPWIIRIVIVIAALAVGTYSAFELRNYFSNNRPQEKVLVAATDIMPNMTITTENVGYVEMPQGSKMHDSIQKPEQVIGKKSTTYIYKGEQFLSQKVTESDLAIEANERALGVPVDSVKAVGMTIKPGNKVDIYWLPKESAQHLTQKTDVITQAKLIAQGSTILDLVNKNSQSVFAVAPAVQEENKRDSGAPSVAVIKVQNNEVPAIVTAVGNGEVYLVKR